MAGVGAKTICSLTLISDLVYGAAPSSRHPVRYSFAHGGTDGHPSPADRANHDSSTAILEQALRRVKVGDR